MVRKNAYTLFAKGRSLLSLHEWQELQTLAHLWKSLPITYLRTIGKNTLYIGSTGEERREPGNVLSPCLHARIFGQGATKVSHAQAALVSANAVAARM